MKKTVFSKSEKETIKIAEGVARDILACNEKGKLVFLKGGLGAGKTIFAKGVASAIGIKENIESPTFVFVREYYGGKIPLYHFDLYRIETPAELDELGFFEYLSKDGIILVEWAEKAEEYADPCMEITIEKINENERKITISNG